MHLDLLNLSQAKSTLLLAAEFPAFLLGCADHLPKTYFLFKSGNGFGNPFDPGFIGLGTIKPVNKIMLMRFWE